jgi:GH35 family endo-1,4-beta-xylanase
MQDYIWDRIRDLIPYLREEHGIRVDGIGWQGHIQYFKDHDWSMEGDNISYLGDLIDWAHGNDLEFHLTEINIHDIGDEPSKESEYADVFGNILSTILSKRNGGVVSWSVWYFTDRPHFRMKNKFLNCLWDKNYQPHEAYHRVQNLLMYPPKADKNTDGSLGK